MMAVITVLWGADRLFAGLWRETPVHLGFFIGFVPETRSCTESAWLPEQGVTSRPFPLQTFMVYQLMFAIITPRADYRRVLRSV